MGAFCLFGFFHLYKTNLTEATFYVLTLALNNLSVFSGQDNDNVHCW